MAYIKISEKGKALLSKRLSSSRVVNAIVRGGDAIATKEGLLVAIDGNGATIRVRSASPVTVAK